MNFPIVITERAYGSDGDKRFDIYCFAPLLNDFNGHIEIFYETRTDWSSGERVRDKQWRLSFGGNSYTQQEAGLIAQGLEHARTIMEGDAGLVVTREPMLDAFVKAVAAKRELDAAKRAEDKERAAKVATQAKANELAARRKTAAMQGLDDLLVDKHLDDTYRITEVVSGYVRSRKFKTMAGALKAAAVLNGKVS